MGAKGSKGKLNKSDVEFLKGNYQKLFIFLLFETMHDTGLLSKSVRISWLWHYIHYLSHCKQSAYAKAFRGAYSRFCTGGGGGEIQNLYLHRAERVITTREAWFRFPKFFLGGVPPNKASFPPPPINIIRINTLGKTHIKKVVGPVVWTTKKKRKKYLWFYKKKLPNLIKHKKN